jgi:superfamily II DNA or RNA helicase
MSTKFFTNEGENTLLAKFAGVFEANKDIQRFDALVGYLRASGYFSIRPHLEKVPRIRILVGINVDEIVESYHRKGYLFLADAGASVDKFKAALTDDIANSKYSPEIEGGIRQFVNDVLSNRLEIKAHPIRNLHAKIYLFIPEGFGEHKTGSVITGSSNLTDAGLGTKDKASNYEFNVLLHDFSDVQFASSEFERLWLESIPILSKDVVEIKDKSFLREDITPLQLYIKFLSEYFGAAVEYDPNSEADLPEGFLKLTYQMDAVSQGFQMLKKHRGFFLADVVGLGKTVIATLIAKKFFYHNDFPSHISSTLIIVPPALEENWREYVSKFELKEVQILTSGSLHKIRDPEKYDLIIVDEAHKFRTDTAQSYESLQKLCKTPTKHRLSDGSLAEKRIILISATPLNNKPEDIRNLLLLFQDGKDSSLEVANLQRFFHNHQKDFEKALQNSDRAIGLAAVKRIYDEIRKRVLEEITIRRTRTDLEMTSDYKEDLVRQGIRFPKVEPPHKVFYRLDATTEVLYDETVTALHSQLNYERYKAINNLIAPIKVKYPNAGLVSTQLARIMKTMLLKRLDSSFHAFKKSLTKFRDATAAMIKMFENGRIFIAPEENVTEAILEGKEEELLDRLTTRALTDGTVAIYKPSDFEPNFLPALESDLIILTELVERWAIISVDPKLDELIRHLKGELVNKSVNPSGKVVIFSEAKDTTDYLEVKLKMAGFDRLISVSAVNRKVIMPLIKANFDANAPIGDQRDDIDVVISTEVLAEGVNLHRSNVVVNYDTPWNSTRLMQRLGRVNRIGSTANSIHIYNFFPTSNVDNVIGLAKRALFKLQAFHSALGEDSQIFSVDEEHDTFGLFEKTPEEERDERLEFLDELRRFRRENLGEYKSIKNLPLRSRVGRKDQDRSNSTIAYVRNARRDAFYKIKNDEEGAVDLEELGFVEAARIFRAGAKERAFNLPVFHHDHVLQAIDEFRKQLASEAVQSETVRIVAPDEKQAMKLLEALQNIPSSFGDILAPEDRELLKAGADTIRNARFDPLRRKLVKISKGHQKMPLSIPILLDKTLEVLREFPITTESDVAREKRFAGIAYRQLIPEIILSESFDG